MNVIRKLLHKWEVNKARRAIGKGFVHCILCGHELKVKMSQYLALVNKSRVTDFPTCSDCTELIQQAELESVEDVGKKS